MKHNRNSVGLCSAVDDLELLNAVEVVVGIEQLVRRVNLDHADIQAQKLVHIRLDIRSVARMQAATGEQALGVFLHIISDELVYTVGKANDLGRDIVDEGSAFDSRCVKMFKEGFGRTAEFNDLIVIRPLAFHQLKRVRFE